MFQQRTQRLDSGTKGLDWLRLWVWGDSNASWQWIVSIDSSTSNCLPFHTAPFRRLLLWGFFSVWHNYGVWSESAVDEGRTSDWFFLFSFCCFTLTFTLTVELKKTLTSVNSHVSKQKTEAQAVEPRAAVLREILWRDLIFSEGTGSDWLLHRYRYQCEISAGEMDQ